MAVSDQPLDFAISASDLVVMSRMFVSHIVEGFAFIDEHVVNYGFCLVVSVMLVGLMMFLHLSIWTKPAEQKKILVIISIPPILGFVSFIALQLNEDWKILFLVLDCIKECCAGLVIPMFMSLCQAYMKVDTRKSSQDFLHKFEGRLVENYFPMTLIQPHNAVVDQYYPKFLEYWTRQFVPIRLVCFFFMILLQLSGMYPLWLSWTFYFILNVSVSLAFSTVFAFFVAFMDKFPRDMILARFYYFRLIVNFCFFQGLVVKVLVVMGVVKSNHSSDNLVVVEMMLLSLFQCFAFSPALYSFSYSSRQLKKSPIAQPDLVDLKKSGQDSVSQSSLQMRSTAIAQPKLKSLGSHSSPQFKRTKLAAKSHGL